MDRKITGDSLEYKLSKQKKIKQRTINNNRNNSINIQKLFTN
jgi:hypothetical protein